MLYQTEVVNDVYVRLPLANIERGSGNMVTVLPSDYWYLHLYLYQGW
jgi:hypothetical protein